MGLLDDADAHARSSRRESDQERRAAATAKRVSLDAMDKGAREYAKAAIVRGIPMTRIYGWSKIRHGWVVTFPPKHDDEYYSMGSIVIGPDGNWLWCTSRVSRPMFGKAFDKWTTSDADNNRPERNEVDLSASRIYNVFKTDLAKKINAQGMSR